MFSGLCGIALLVLPIWVLMNLGRGLDVSDAGYYHASISYLSDNRMAVTQFGVVWNLLPVPDDILMRRGALFLWVTLASGWMAIEAFSLLNRAHLRTQTSGDQILFASVGIGAGVFYASLWLVDPSYNSTALGLSCGLVALAIRLVRTRAQAPASLVVAGALVVLLLYARPPTAAALGLSLSLFVLVLVRPNPRRLVKLVGGSIAGMVGAIGLVWLLVEAPSETWSRFQGGLELAGMLARDVDHFDHLERFTLGLLRVASQSWFILLWAFLISASAVFRPFRTQAAQALLAASLSVLVVLVMALHLRTLSDAPLASYAFQSDMAALTGLLAVVIAAGRIVPTANRPRRRLDTRRLALVLALLVASLAVVFWTASLWFPRLAWVGVFPVLALLVAVHSENRWRFMASASLVVGVLAMLQYAFWTSVSHTPYRLSGPLQAQTLPTEIRHGRSTLRTDAATHTLLNTLTRVSTDLARCEGKDRPVLLDMTGRMPMVAYHINARPPGRSWVLSGYPGSADLFGSIVGNLDDATLQAAWILDAPDYSRGHDPGVLAARGVNYVNDYDLVAELHAPYPDTQIRLYRPKAGVVCDLT